MGLNPCGLIGKSTFDPIHKIANWKKGSRLAFLRASSKNPSPRSPAPRINTQEKVPLIAYLNIKVPDKTQPPNSEYTIELTCKDLPKKQNFLGMKRSKQFRNIERLLDLYHRLSKTPDSREQLKDILKDLEEACNQYIKTKGKNYDTKKIIEEVLNQAKMALISIHTQSVPQANPPFRPVGSDHDEAPPPFTDTNEQPLPKPIQLTDLESSLDILDHSRQHHVNSNELHNAIACIADYLCNLVVPDQGYIFNRIADNLVQLPKEHLSRLLCQSEDTSCLGELDTIADSLNRLGRTNQAQRIRNYIAKSLFSIAEELYEQGRYNDVLSSMDMAQKQFHKLGDGDNVENTVRLKANYYFAIAENHYQQGQYNDALNSMVNAKSVFEELRGRDNDNVENTQRLIDKCQSLIDNCNYWLAEGLSKQLKSGDPGPKETIQSLPSQNFSAAQTLFENGQHDKAMLRLLKAKKGFKALSDADGLKDTMQLMARIHLARAGKACKDPNNKATALKILNTFVLPICKKLGDDATLAILQNRLLPCLEGKSQDEGKPQDINSLFGEAHRTMGRLVEQHFVKDVKVAIIPSISQPGFLRIEDIPVPNYEAAKHYFEDNYISDKSIISGKDSNCFIRCIAKYAAKINKIKENEIETVVNDVAKMIDDSGLRKRPKEGGSYPFIEDLAFPLSDPVAMAVKRYFDKKYHLDIATNTIEIARKKDNSANVMQQCSDRNAQDVIFIHFINNNHFELIYPKSEKLTGWKEKKFNHQDYQSREAVNEFLWNAFKETSEGKPFCAKMEEFDKLLEVKLSLRPEPEDEKTSREKIKISELKIDREVKKDSESKIDGERKIDAEDTGTAEKSKPFRAKMEEFYKLLEVKLSLRPKPEDEKTSREKIKISELKIDREVKKDSESKIDGERKIDAEDTGDTAETGIGYGADDLAITTVPFANPRILLQMAGLSEAEVNRLSEKHVNNLARFASHGKTPCDTKELLERLKDALDKTGKALETSLSKAQNLGKNGKKVTRRAVELKRKFEDLSRYLDSPKTYDSLQPANKIDKNRDDRFVPLIGQEILIFMAEAESHVQETLGLLEKAGGHDEDIAKLGRDWLDTNRSPKLSALNDPSLRATLETDFEGRPCLYLRTGEVAQKTVPPLAGQIYANKRDAAGHAYPPSDLDTKYQETLARMDEITDLFVARYSEISSSQIKNEIRILLHEFDAIRKAACQWNQSRDQVQSFFEDLINEIPGKLTKVYENLRSYLQGQKIDSLFFKGTPTPGFETILTALRGTDAPTILEDGNRIPALNLWGEAEKALKMVNKLATDRFLPILQRRHLNSAPFLKGQRGMMKMNLYIKKDELGQIAKDLRAAMDQLGPEIRNTDNPREVIDYIKAVFESDDIQAGSEKTKPANETKKAEAIKTILLCIDKIKTIENDFSVVNTAEKLKYSSDLMVHRVKDDDWWDALFKSRGSDKLRRFIAIADHGLDRVPLGDAFRMTGHTIGLLGSAFGKIPYHFSREIKSYATERSGGWLSWPGFHQWGKRLQNPKAPISYEMAKPLCELLKQLQELDNWLLDQINKLDSKKETRKEPVTIPSEGLNTLTNREVRYRHLRATYLAALATIMNGGEIPKKVEGMRIEAWSKMHNVDMQELEYLIYNRCHAAIESTISDKALEHDIKSAMANPDAYFNRLKQYRSRVAAFAPNYSAKPAFENLVKQILELNTHEQDWATRLAMRMDGIAAGKVGMGEGVANNPYLSLYNIAEHAEKFGTVTNEVTTALNLHFAGATMIPVLFNQIVKHAELFSDYKVFAHHGRMSMGAMDNSIFRFHVTPASQ